MNLKSLVLLGLIMFPLGCAALLPPHPDFTQPSYKVKVPGAAPAGMWVMILPPIGKDPSGQNVVQVSASRFQWIVQGGASKDGCQAMLEQQVALRRHVLNACIASPPGGDRSCRQARVSLLQYENGRCAQSDGGRLFVMQKEGAQPSAVTDGLVR
jgi:hypothetical protein